MLTPHGKHQRALPEEGVLPLLGMGKSADYWLLMEASSAFHPSEVLQHRWYPALGRLQFLHPFQSAWKASPGSIEAQDFA